MTLPSSLPFYFFFFFCKSKLLMTHVWCWLQYLYLFNYYAQFLSSFSAKLSLLYSLLNRKQKWQWDASHDEQALEIANDACSGDSLLVHNQTNMYSCDDPNTELVLHCRLDYTLRVALGLRLGTTIVAPHQCQHCGRR